MGIASGPVGITIRRIRISIQIDFDLTVTALSRDTGLYVQTILETGGLASAAVPNSLSNPDKDYPFRVWIPATGGTGALATATGGHLFVSREFDSKSMRKLHDLGDTIYLSGVPTAAGAVAWRIETSTLLLLP